jgi:exodeoxyribonuclease VII large subunit
MKAITLLDLNRMIRDDLKHAFPETYWVQAEVSECKEHFSGHCYLELIQKKTTQDTICAKARATIWASVWQELGPFFQQQTGTKLQPGQQILAELSVEFHELYGFNLIIKDLDPTYTMGDQARRRLEILHKLEAEGVID